MLAYFDCFSGISGDMTLGALIDMGVPARWLKEKLRSIPLAGFDLLTGSTHRHGIHAVSVTVRVEDHQTHRNYGEIRSLIENSPLDAGVRQTSLNIFEKLADAEAGVHGVPKEQTHFHEIGGIDAIVDIVGAALGISYLGIRKVVASKIPVGTGFVSCSHGTLPVPAPATLAILKGIPIYGSGIQNELATPTGAAIIATLAESFEAMPHMVVEKIGYGAGKRDLEARPNVLRIAAGRLEIYSSDGIMVVETCIDDMNPEVFGFLMQRLFEDGALDVIYIPIFMKKNRPGTLVQVLCRPDRREAVVHRILSESTSLGVRFYKAERHMLHRETVAVKTSYGSVEIKRITAPDGSIRCTPEYEVCKRIALEKNIPIKTVYDRIIQETAEH